MGKDKSLSFTKTEKKPLSIIRGGLIVIIFLLCLPFIFTAIKYYSYRSAIERRQIRSAIERRQIFKEMNTLDNRASMEADIKYPITGQTMWILSEPERRNRIIENIDMEQNLREQYENKLLKKYGLTRERLGEIFLEGIKERWS